MLEIDTLNWDFGLRLLTQSKGDLLTRVISTGAGPRGKVIQDSLNWILDWILNPGSLSVELGFRISVVSEIPDS